MIPLWVYYLLTIELVIVSIQDIRFQKIINLWSFFNIGFFIFLLFIEPKFYFFTFGSLLYSMVILVVGFIFFLIKIMGAGDTKFLASFYFLVPESLQPNAYRLLLISTVIIGLFMLITNFGKNYQKISFHLKRGEVNELKNFFGTKFSFAPVILLSWIWLGLEKGLWF